MNIKKMTNCPNCQKPVIIEGQFTSSAQFSLRCASCQATLKINVQPKITIEILGPEKEKVIAIKIPGSILPSSLPLDKIQSNEKTSLVPRA